MQRGGTAEPSAMNWHSHASLMLLHPAEGVRDLADASDQRGDVAVVVATHARGGERCATHGIDSKGFSTRHSRPLLHVDRNRNCRGFDGTILLAPDRVPFKVVPRKRRAVTTLEVESARPRE